MEKEKNHPKIDEQAIWIVHTPFEERASICSSVIDKLSNDYTQQKNFCQSDIKKTEELNSALNVLTQTSNELKMLTKAHEVNYQDSLESFMNTLTNRLIHVGIGFTKFHDYAGLPSDLLPVARNIPAQINTPFQTYIDSKEMLERQKLSLEINKVLASVNTKGISNNIFLTYDKHYVESYKKIGAFGMGQGDKSTKIRVGILNKNTGITVGCMELVLTTSLQPSICESLGIIPLSKNSHSAELGDIRIDEEFQGNRYSSEAMQLLNELFDDLGVEFSFLLVASDKPYTAKVYQKAGYVLVKNASACIREEARLKLIEIKEEEDAEVKFFQDSSIAEVCMIRYRYGKSPT